MSRCGILDCILGGSRTRDVGSWLAWPLRGEPCLTVPWRALLDRSVASPAWPLPVTLATPPPSSPAPILPADEPKAATIARRASSVPSPQSWNGCAYKEGDVVSVDRAHVSHRSTLKQTPLAFAYRPMNLSTLPNARTTTTTEIVHGNQARRFQGRGGAVVSEEPLQFVDGEAVRATRKRLTIAAPHHSAAPVPRQCRASATTPVPRVFARVRCLSSDVPLYTASRVVVHVR